MPARGLVPLELGVVLVLGANIGGGIIAVMLSRAAPPKARIVPLGNLIMRGTGALIAMIAVVWLKPPLDLARRPRRPNSWFMRTSPSILMLAIVGMPLAGLVFGLAETHHH